MVCSPKGPDLVWGGVVCSALVATFVVASSCWVPHVIAARSVSGCRVGLVVQLRQGRTLAGWDHMRWPFSIPLVLTGHEGCPGRACQLGTVSPAVIAPADTWSDGTLLRSFALRFCCCCCAQRRWEGPFERERARRLRVGCVACRGSLESDEHIFVPQFRFRDPFVAKGLDSSVPPT